MIRALCLALSLAGVLSVSAAESEPVPHAVCAYTDIRGEVSYEALDIEAYNARTTEVSDQVRYLRPAQNAARDEWRRKRESEERKKERSGRNYSTKRSSTGDGFPMLRLTRPSLKKLKVFPDEKQAKAQIAELKAAAEAKAEAAAKRLGFVSDPKKDRQRKLATEMVEEELTALVSKAAKERKAGGYTGTRLGNSDSEDVRRLGTSAAPKRRKSGGFSFDD